jgi:ABC-type multidrug transport system ATPase subunit
VAEVLAGGAAAPFFLAMMTFFLATFCLRVALVASPCPRPAIVGILASNVAVTVFSLLGSAPRHRRAGDPHVPDEPLSSSRAPRARKQTGHARVQKRPRASVILVPLTAAGSSASHDRDRRWPPQRSGNPPAQVPGPGGRFPALHPCSLYLLAIFYVVALALRAGTATFDARGRLSAAIDRAVAFLLGNPLGLVVLAAPAFVALFLSPTWAVWFGIPTPETGLVPNAAALAAFGTAFGAGWVLQRQKDPFSRIGRLWHVHLAAAICLSATCLALVGVAPNLMEPTVLQGGLETRALYAAAYTLSVWCWTFGLLGAAVRFCSRENAARRYVADASYWFYLAHLPVVFALQTLFMTVPIPWAVKYPVIVLSTLGVLFLTYHAFVRRTVVGEILNGRVRSDAPPETNPAATSPAAVPIASLRNVTKRYGKAIALDRVSLDVGRGELLAVLGPNGAGKSTAIGLWLGTLQADEGDATLLGGSPLDVHSRLGVGVMMQEVALAPMLTAREHVALTASCYRDPLSTEEVISFAGISSIEGKRYGKLSGGQKRQVQFATAICGRPRLLFLDEPTVGLDLEAREAMWRNIRRLREEGCAIVLTTHHLEEAEALADRVVVLARGRVLAEGSVDEMRALVTRTHVRCVSALPAEEVASWTGVAEAARDGLHLAVMASDAEGVVRRLLAEDPALRRLEVRQASLAEAFTEITREAA